MNKMMTTKVIAVGTLALAAILSFAGVSDKFQSTSSADDMALVVPRPIDMEYNFQSSKPLFYTVIEQSHTVGNIVGEAGAVNSTFDYTVRCRLVLTPKTRTPDVTVFIVTCEKRKVDWTVFYGTNKLVLTMTDAGTIKGTANSEPVVQEGDEFRQDVAGLYRTGEISVTRQGLVNICSGGKEFEEYWGRWERLFPLVFPARSVSVGDTWTRSFRHPSLSKMVLPFDSSEKIVTERKQDLVVAGRTCSVFRITSQLSASPANQEIGVSGFTEAATLFDSNLGVLFRSSSKHKARSEVTQSVHGKPVKLIQSTECSAKMFLETE